MSPPQALGATARRGLVWLVICALCVYACSGAMLRMLGPAHWHATVATATPAPPAASHHLAEWLAPALQRVHMLLEDVQALSERVHAQSHALGLETHPHSHSSLLRHWHSPHDDSVRTLASDAVDPELADLKAAAAIGGATLLPAPGPAPSWQALAQPNGAWPAAYAPQWRSADSAPPVDPPIA